MGETIKILCVDDEVNVLRSLQRVFMDEDYEILSAGSGEEGLAILESRAPIQVVISDYRMPVMNGVDFLKAVYERWPETVRIVLSGYADTAAVVEAVNEGHIYQFIPKPWKDEELKARISVALERYSLRQKNLRLIEYLRHANEELKRSNNDLERLVEERAAKLLLHGHALTFSQNVLDNLPVGVVGIDDSGMVILCNRSAQKFLGKGGEVLGVQWTTALPEEFKAEVRRLIQGEALSKIFAEVEGKRLWVAGSRFDSFGSPAVVVAFGPVDDEMPVGIDQCKPLDSSVTEIQ